MFAKAALAFLGFISFSVQASEIHCMAVENRQLPVPEEFKMTEWHFAPDADGDVSELFLSPLFSGYSYQVESSKDLQFLSVKLHYAQNPIYRSLVNSVELKPSHAIAKLTMTETIAKSPKDVQQRISLEFACSRDTDALAQWAGALK